MAAITARGITPAALEMMDGFTLRAVEEATHAGYPIDCAAVLLIEVEGLKEAVEDHADEIEAVCRGKPGTRGAAREIRGGARSAVEGKKRQRLALWAASAPTTTCRTA